MANEIAAIKKGGEPSEGGLLYAFIIISQNFKKSMEVRKWKDLARKK